MIFVCQQRFDSFRKALAHLQEALQNGAATLNQLEKEGAAQRFEFTFELAWKTLKDFLEFNGVKLASVTPKSVIKAAFAARIIKDGQIWIDMLLQRNALSHKNDGNALSNGLEIISTQYLGELSRFADDLLKQGT
ncbi:MAG: nucleotidyltransferase substrate binding protein [Deltaproteobacteria bacterium]|nr:nucleotidyltransferase substrate binding protein [Deltaproteobacteria bacterium]